MNNTRISISKKYWIYMILVSVLGMLLVVGILFTDGITGEKPFREFTQQEWCWFALCLLGYIMIMVSMFIFATKAGKINQKYELDVRQYYEQFKYAGINPGDCDYVWFDFSEDERAKIIKMGAAYHLYVESFDHKTETWNPVNSVSIYSSVAEVKKALFYEFDFFCEENAVLDKYGDEIFREDIR